MCDPYIYTHILNHSNIYTYVWCTGSSVRLGAQGKPLHTKPKAI